MKAILIKVQRTTTESEKRTKLEKSVSIPSLTFAFLVMQQMLLSIVNYIGSQNKGTFRVQCLA